MASTSSHTALIEEGNTLDFILDIISEGVWDWNVLTGHVHRSAGWFKMLEYDIDCFDENVHTWQSVIHPQDYTRVMQHFESYIDGKVDSYKIKYRCRKGDGTYLWIEDSGKIVERDENGKLTRMIGAHTDINEIELANQKLLLQNRLLQSNNAILEVDIEKAVEDIRKKDLQLIEQSRLAQMGELIGMIAHQWRQPISAISMEANNMLLDIELGDLDVSASEEYANSISEHTQFLSKTIDDFRNFYKPNKQSLRLKLEEVVFKSLNVIKASLLNKNIEIIEEYNSKEAIELYDSELMQVVLNILINAQDNFQEKQIKNPYIKITTENRTISICDNAGGVEEGIKGKIFDPYFSTKDEKNGTGLGLYMSKIIVEEHHNGKLSVQNTDDGVLFTIEVGTISEK